MVETLLSPSSRCRSDTLRQSGAMVFKGSEPNNPRQRGRFDSKRTPLSATESGVHTVGSTAKARRSERHQARTHRSNGAKQRVTSSSVWQGLARSLPS